MDQIKSILRSYLSNRSFKATARQLKVSRNTVREYVRRAEAYSADLSVFRKHRRMEFFLRLSKLRYQATIADIQCSESHNSTP